MEILIYLLKCKKTTYKELAHTFEVSVKTIERDIDRLSAMGIPVYCTQGAGGGVHIDRNYKFSTSFFTQEDIHQIIFALKIMDSLSEISKKDAIINKLCLLSPELAVLFENDAKEYLSIDLLPQKVNVASEIFNKINDCLDNEFFAIINGSLRVAPIRYVLKSDGMYLFCFSDCYQMIPCHSIEHIEVTNLIFERDFISYEEYKKNNR